MKALRYLVVPVMLLAMSASSNGKEDAPRFAPLAKAQMTPEQTALAEQVLKVSSIGLGGPYNAMLRSPDMGQRMFDLLDYLRWKTSVPKRLNEFAILIVGRHWRSQVEWYAHAPIAAKAGLPQSVIDDLKADKRPATMQPDEAAVHDFVTELLAQHKVSDATFARAKGILGEQGIADLTAVTGTYVTVAMLIDVAQESVPAGKEPPFKDGE